MNSRVADKFMLRMPDGYRQQLKIRAAVNRRSMNAEIISMIDRVLRDAPEATGEGFADTTPAASLNTSARQGADVTTNGY